MDVVVLIQLRRYKEQRRERRGSRHLHAVPVFHIEPRRPRAEDIISAARPAKVPSWPSTEDLGVRSFRGIATGLVVASSPSACAVEVNIVGCGSGFVGDVMVVFSVATGEFAGVG